MLAKTDRLDASILTNYGQKFNVTPQKMPTEKQRELFDFSQYRNLIQKNLHRVEMLLEHEKSKALLKLIRKQVRSLRTQLAAVEKEIEALIYSHPPFKAAYKAFMTVKGVGPATALALLAYMPEIGTLSRKKLAALAGVAPMNNDSGEMKGRRRIQGGRANFRRQLYMAALVGSRHNEKLREHYQSLLSRGMKKKSALVSVMRKLLTHLNSIAKELLSERDLGTI